MLAKTIAPEVLEYVPQLCLNVDAPPALDTPAGHRAQLSQLPDAQRREAAADLVMQLLDAMGLDDEEEGTDEEGA